MTLKEIKRRIIEIEKISDDDEQAHYQEDCLYWDFIKHVARTKGEFQEMAKEILKTQEIDFTRRYE